MSEQEFDLYLRLMSRLLKLSRDQEAMIADELRDHMEERFHELVRAGLTREQAIERALGEFGDAAVLANEFSSLTRRRRRKVWARMSILGATAAACLTAGVITLWPRPDAAKPNPATLFADEEAKPAEKTAAPGKLVVKALADRAIPSELLNEIDVDFPDNTLTEVMDYFSQIIQIPVRTGNDLIDSGINPAEAKVRLQMRGPAYLVLDRLCQDGLAAQGVQLDWSFEDRILRFSTREVIAERRGVRSYDVASLVGHGMPIASLVPLLPPATSGSWELDEPGTSTVNALGNRLIVRADVRQQRDVASLLAALDQAVQGGASVLYSDVASETLAVSEKLSESAEANFPDNTLSEIASYFQDVHQIPIRFDQSLIDAGLNPEETKVSVAVSDRPLSTVLQVVLDSVQGASLCYVPRQGMISIMTRDAANEVRTTAVYDVTAFEKAGIVSDLISAITATTEPWEMTEPGTGTLQQPLPGFLVIRQTAEVHRQIQQLINEQRDSLVELTPEEREAQAAVVETRIYRLGAETEEDIQEVIEATIFPGTWGVAGQTHWIQRVRLTDLTKQPSLPAGIMGGGGGGGGEFGGGGGGGGFFQFGGGGVAPQQVCEAPTVGPSAVLFVRHTRETHRRIDILIHALRRQAQPTASLGGPSLGPAPQYGAKLNLEP
jgi:hypothetical protein